LINMHKSTMPSIKDIELDLILNPSRPAAHAKHGSC